MKTKSTLLFLSVLLLVLMIGVPTAQSQFRDLDEGNPDEVYYTLPGGAALVLRVEQGNNFDLTPSPGGGGAFYIGGSIFNEGESSGNGDEAIGRFDCWGWITADPDSPGFVSQEWNLFGVGKLLLSGAEDAGPRAITGGTGQFRNVRGQATGFEFFDGSFVATFELLGAGG
jgi:hypothetical protein